MTSQNTPGVYIEEVATLGASVAAVPTAIPGFAGFTETAIINGSQWDYGNSTASNAAYKPAPAVRISSLLEYRHYFGVSKDATYDVDITGTAASPIYTVTSTPPTFSLYYYMQLYFANGGGPCYVSSVGSYSSTPAPNTPTSLSADALVKGLAEFEKVDEVTLLLAPEALGLVNNSSDESNLNSSLANVKTVYDAALGQCNTLQDRFALLDVFTGSKYGTDSDKFRSNTVGANSLKYGAAYYPSLKTTLNYSYTESAVDVTDSRSNNERVYTSATTLAGVAGTNKAIYSSILAELKKQTVVLNPAAAMAGVYARVDANRGVWKAPANVSLTMVSGPSIMITDATQADLNIHAASGKSINVIRQFTGKGTIVWGGRTLAGNDNEWKYINVRRLFSFVEESVKKATEFVVFEPNTADTWLRVKSMCEAFLTGLWRDGGLAGSTAKEAFFVKVGLGSTMNADDVLNGKMIIEIGLAASRPAEFIILKFSHKLQES